MKRTIWVNCIAYFFILLFLYTGLAKLTEIHLFKEQLTSSPLLGSMAGFITWALPISEILLSILLFIPAWQLKGLYATFIVMALFTLYVVIILFMDDHLSCSCGGIVEELSPKQHVLFNSACVILCGIAILMARKKYPNLQFMRLTRVSSIALFLIIGWTLFTAFSAPATEKTGMEGRLMPPFTLLLTDSTTRLNSTDIPSGNPIIVIGFSPTCTHCGKETDDIVKNIAQFKDTRIYFVTPYPFNEMKGFYRYFKLDRYPNVTMGRDSSDYFMTYFKASTIPFTAIFDSKKRLKQAFVNPVDAARLSKAIAE
jgi:hypothetical protein